MKKVLEQPDCPQVKSQQRLLLLSHCTGKVKPHGVKFEDGCSSLGTQWLTAMPSAELGQIMTPAEFQVALKFYLLMPLFSTAIPCAEPSCVALFKTRSWTIDRFGYHILYCRKTGNRTKPRHEVLADSLGDVAQDAGLNARVNAPVR